MFNANLTDNEAAAETPSLPAANEAMLRSEIGFWRELIDSCDESQPADSIERMQQALALAETRLQVLFQKYLMTPGEKAGGKSNVYHLDKTRRQRK